MAPRPKKTTLIFVIQIGVTRPGTETNSKFLERAKSIVQRMIEHRIFLQPKDEIGVILTGYPDEPENDNTKEYIPIQIPNFRMIQQLNHLESTSCPSNWIKGVEVAVNCIITTGDFKNKKRIIVISDFKEEENIVEQYEVDSVLKALQNNEIQLHAIAEEFLDIKREDLLTPSEKFLKVLLDNKIGKQQTFEDAHFLFRYYEEQPKNPTPWYCTLDLVDTKIPIASYIKIDDKAKLPAWTRVKGEEKVKRITQYVDNQRQVYKKEDTETGYKYGSAPVPATVVEQNIEYKSSEKCYKIHSFTKRSLVGLEYWCSGSTRIVLPANQMAAKPFYCLIRAMERRNLVALVRKVYNRNSTPKMVALFPCIDVSDEPWCFVEIELPFAEDQRIIGTMPIRSILKQLTNEQSELIDNLLESLTVKEEEDNFTPGSIHNPAMQHKWHAFSHRALKPSEPLPEMEEYLKNAFDAPTVRERTKPYLRKMKEIFDLEVKKPEAKEKAITGLKSTLEAKSDNVKSVSSDQEASEMDIKNDSIEDDEFDVDITKFMQKI